MEAKNYSNSGQEENLSKMTSLEAISVTIAELHNERIQAADPGILVCLTVTLLYSLLLYSKARNHTGA